MSARGKRPAAYGYEAKMIVHNYSYRYYYYYGSLSARRVEAGDGCLRVSI
jgi:hypothetical protein